MSEIFPPRASIARALRLLTWPTHFPFFRENHELIIACGNPGIARALADLLKTGQLYDNEIAQGLAASKIEVTGTGIKLTEYGQHHNPISPA